MKFSTLNLAIYILRLAIKNVCIRSFRRAVSITGKHFPSDKTIIIKFGGTQVATSKTDSHESFSGADKATFKIPDSFPGSQKIEVFIFGYTHASARQYFTITIAPTKLTLNCNPTTINNEQNKRTSLT
jgi:hypothetical protein